MIRRALAALLLAMCTTLPACTAAPPASDADGITMVTPPDTVHRLERVPVIGASASAGFLATLPTDRGPQRVNLTTIFDAILAPSPDAATTPLASEMFFLSPRQAADYQLQQATANDPTCIIGIDFLFWFGYGIVQRDENQSETDARLALLESGLDKLDAIGDTSIVLGDLPDMSDAIGRMLNRRQVPSPEALDALNTRIREWAADKPNVLLLDFHQLVGRLKSDEPFQIAGNTWTEQDARRLLLRDRLHPSPEGLILVGIFIADQLIQQGWADPERLTLDRIEIRKAIESSTGPADDPTESPDRE